MGKATFLNPNGIRLHSDTHCTKTMTCFLILKQLKSRLKVPRCLAGVCGRTLETSKSSVYKKKSTTRACFYNTYTCVVASMSSWVIYGTHTPCVSLLADKTTPYRYLRGSAWVPWLLLSARPTMAIDKGALVISENALRV